MKARPVRPLTSTAYLRATRSSQPTRRGRPVVAPNSAPILRIFSAIAGSDFSISVGNGPSPTRAVYALVIPITCWTAPTPTPEPVIAPPATVFDDVTYGYVPW